LVATEEAHTLMTELSVLIDDHLRASFAADPVEATRLGVHDHDHELGTFDRDRMLARREELTRTIAGLEALDTTALTRLETLDHTVALADARVALRRHDDQRVWERAPYWYLERLGSSLSTLMTRRSTPLEARAAALLARLRATPEYLETASVTLTSDTPAVYAQMGRTAAAGLATFLAEAMPAFAEEVPDALRSDLAAATEGAGAAVASFSSSLEGLAARAEGSYQAGAAHVDFLLDVFHRAAFDHDELHEWGREQVARDRAALDELAEELDPSSTWMEQIARIKDHHPEPEAFITAYGDEMMLAREHCLEQDLITIPEGEVCHMRWLPAYLRASLPIAVMATTPPFEPGLDSEWLITPLDLNAPADRQRQHMRDNCYAFCRSIAGHEIYPGHHLQKVHHKLVTADSPIRRYVSSPLFVEGWGLYTEDLLTETGLLTEPDVRLFKLRNALWRSARVVVDTGLHTRGMTFDDAADVLEREVCLDRHMAEGEVRRYIRHDNPTYPSSYLLGRTAIHELRDRALASLYGASDLKTFHDRLLGYGSIPMALIAEQFELEGLVPGA
jgi:uncharacterized protein (DUF885 family)